MGKGLLTWLATAFVESLICVKFGRGWLGDGDECMWGAALGDGGWEWWEKAAGLAAELAGLAALLLARLRRLYGAQLQENCCSCSHECTPPHPFLRLFPQPWPRKVLVAWGTAAAVFVVVFGTWCWRYYVLARRGTQAATAVEGRRAAARVKAQ